MTTAYAPPRTAREYLRVSIDHTGQQRSPEEQHDEHEETAAELGVTLGDPYQDIGSASRYARKARDDFERLLDDLRTDQFGADLLWMWESSRGSRKTGEWVTLLDLCEEKGVRFYVQTHERILDPRNGNDRRTLLLDAVDSEHEAYKTSKRVLRGVKTNLNHPGGARGHGICPFGYGRSYERTRDQNGRRVLRPTEQRPLPAEAARVIELFYRIRAGHSMTSIERDFAASGVVGRRDKPMSAATLRGMATRVAYIGKRTHKGKTLPASWPCIAAFEGASYNGQPVSVDDFVKVFHEVKEILEDPARRTNMSGGAKHDFSGALKCGVCGDGMTVTYRDAGGKPQPAAYQCHGRGCTRVNKEDTDNIVRPAVLGYLAVPENYVAFTPRDGGAQLAAVQADLAVKQADLKETQNTQPETLAEERRLARREDRLEAEIAELKKREAKLTPGPSPLTRVFPYGPDVAKRWEAAPVEVRRKVARLVLTEEALGEVRVRQERDSASPAAVDRLDFVRRLD